MMEFETASKCCSRAVSNSTHGNSTATAREGRNVQLSGGQTSGMDFSATCLPGPSRGELENEDDDKEKCNSVPPENRKSGSVVAWGLVSPSAERETPTCSKNSDDSSSSRSPGYALGETQRAGRMEEDSTDDPAGRSASSERSPDTAAARRTVKLMQTPIESLAAPVEQASAAVEAAKTFAALAGETDKPAITPSSIVWTEFVHASIPANVRAYEELLRCCVSPAASASPVSAGKTGNTTGTRKSSTGTDHGGASLSRFETLSTQPSHPRLFAEDVADDCSPRHLPATLPSAPESEQEDGHHHRSRVVSAEDGEEKGDEQLAGARDIEQPAAAKNIEADKARALMVQQPQQQAEEEDARGIAVEKREAAKPSDGLRVWSRCGAGNNDSSAHLGAEAGVSDTGEESSSVPPSSNVKIRTVQAERAPSTEDDIRPPVEGAQYVAEVAPTLTAEAGRAPHRAVLLAQVSPGTSVESEETQVADEELTHTILHGGTPPERDHASATGANCGAGASPLIRQPPCILSPKQHIEAAQFDSTTGAEHDAAARCTAATCLAPGIAAPSELACVKGVAQDETGSEATPPAAGAEEGAAYIARGTAAAVVCGEAESTPVIACDDAGRHVECSGATRGSGTGPSSEPAVAVHNVSPGSAMCVANRLLRGGALAGESGAPVLSRGRPSLGAAGRQLLLDRIRAKYHTNVGLYSGVLRKNYNSTISKLPFFTVSLLHRLAADFGIDTNAVLEQQQQQNCDSTRGTGCRHSAENNGFPTGGGGGGRGGRQSGTFGVVAAGATRGGGATGSGGAFYLRNTGADRRPVPSGESNGGGGGAGTYSPAAHHPTADKRRGRLHYESLTRRRYTRRGATKKSGSTSDGATGSSGERGESLCPAPRGARRRPLGLRSNRARSWESDAVDSSSPVRTQEPHEETTFFMGDSNMRAPPGGLASSPEHDPRVQSRKAEPQHEQRAFDDYEGEGPVVSCIREEAAAGEAWTEGDQTLQGGQAGSLSSASGTMIRARAVAIEKRREEARRRSSAGHDEVPHYHAESTCTTTTIELLGSRSAVRGAGHSLSQEKWGRTAGDGPPLFVREGQGRCDPRHRLLTALSSLQEGEENDGGRRRAAELGVLRARFSEGTTTLSSKNEHMRWLTGGSAAGRVPLADSSERAHQQQHDAVEKAFAGALSYSSRRAATSADGEAFDLWSREGGRLSHSAAAALLAGAEEKKRRDTCSSSHSSSSTSGGSGSVALCGSAVSEGEAMRSHTIHKENVSVCELPPARYLWSVLFKQLPAEVSAGRVTAEHTASAAGGYHDLCQTGGAARGAQQQHCEETGADMFHAGGFRRCSTAQLNACDVSQQEMATIGARDRKREVPTTTKTPLLSGPQPKEAVLSSLPPSAGGGNVGVVRSAAERTPVSRGQEWLSRLAPATLPLAATTTAEAKAYEQDATHHYGRKAADPFSDGGPALLPAVSWSETEGGMSAVVVSDVKQRLLLEDAEAAARAAAAQEEKHHLRKRLRTEVVWPSQREEDLPRSRPAMQQQSHPASNGHHGTKNYSLPITAPREDDHPATSSWVMNRRGIVADERLLEVLSRRPEGGVVLPHGGPGGQTCAADHPTQACAADLPPPSRSSTDTTNSCLFLQKKASSPPVPVRGGGADAAALSQLGEKKAVEEGRRPLPTAAAIREEETSFEGLPSGVGSRVRDADGMINTCTAGEREEGWREDPTHHEREEGWRENTMHHHHFPQQKSPPFPIRLRGNNCCAAERVPTTTQKKTEGRRRLSGGAAGGAGPRHHHPFFSPLSTGGEEEEEDAYEQYPNGLSCSSSLSVLLQEQHEVGQSRGKHLALAAACRGGQQPVLPNTTTCGPNVHGGGTITEGVSTTSRSTSHKQLLQPEPWWSAQMDLRLSQNDAGARTTSAAAAATFAEKPLSEQQLTAAPAGASSSSGAPSSSSSSSSLSSSSSCSSSWITTASNDTVGSVSSSIGPSTSAAAPPDVVNRYLTPQQHLQQEQHERHRLLLLFSKTEKPSASGGGGGGGAASKVLVPSPAHHHVVALEETRSGVSGAYTQQGWLPPRGTAEGNDDASKSAAGSPGSCGRKQRADAGWLLPRATAEGDDDAGSSAAGSPGFCGRKQRGAADAGTGAGALRPPDDDVVSGSGSSNSSAARNVLLRDPAPGDTPGRDPPARDLPADSSMPLASLLLSSLLAEEATGRKLSESNASSSSAAGAGGPARYTSRVVALLQTLSELQKKLASMQLPATQAPAPRPQCKCGEGEGIGGGVGGGLIGGGEGVGVGEGAKEAEEATNHYLSSASMQLPAAQAPPPPPHSKCGEGGGTGGGRIGVGEGAEEAKEATNEVKEATNNSPSSSPLSTATTAAAAAAPKEERGGGVPLQQQQQQRVVVPKFNVLQGVLCSLLPDLLQKAEDGCSDTAGPGVRQRAGPLVLQQQQQQHLQPIMQQRKQEEAATKAGGHGHWSNAKSGNAWPAVMTQDGCGPRETKYDGGSERRKSISCSSARRPQDRQGRQEDVQQADDYTPLALEAIENFLKAQGGLLTKGTQCGLLGKADQGGLLTKGALGGLSSSSSGDCSGYPPSFDGRPSLVGSQQEGRVCSNGQNDRPCRQRCAAAPASTTTPSHEMPEASGAQGGGKTSGKLLRNTGEAASLVGWEEDAQLASHTGEEEEDRRLHTAKDELRRSLQGDCCALQQSPPYAARLTAVHGAQQRERYGLDHMETKVKNKVQGEVEEEEEERDKMGRRQAEEDKTGRQQAEEETGRRQAAEETGRRQAEEKTGGRQAEEKTGGRQADEKTGGRQAEETTRKAPGVNSNEPQTPEALADG